MRTYVMTSGAIFGVLFVTHLLRIVEEGARLAREPEFVLITLAAAALSVWAFWSLRRQSPR